MNEATNPLYLSPAAIVTQGPGPLSWPLARPLSVLSKENNKEGETDKDSCGVETLTD